MVQPEDVIPFGYEIIAESIGRIHSAYLRPLGFLIIKRADVSSSSYSIFGFSMVHDFCIAVQDEELIEGYTPLIWLEHSKSQEKSEEAKCNVQLGFKKSPPVGICDLTYEHATLDRYPYEVET